ncbi:MAG: glycosyltransferase family 2 protein [Candidatus Chisholmbacteria bacterium]|nr:glycosyltransferase family 2 protein [Candidatus Chisholmbacteria bacterium]
MKLSIIITSFNTRVLLKECLTSLKHSQDKLEKEIIVVDNASEDGSPEMIKTHFKEVKLLKSTRNLGYGRANNLGLKHATGEYILFLNSDTFVPPQTLGYMAEFMASHPDVGVATCQLQLPQGGLDPASHRGFPTPWASFTFFVGLERLFPRSQLFGQYHQGWKNLEATHEIDTPAGAFYLTRKKILRKVGGFDEQFFIYAEDIDLSLRIKKAGWKIVFVPIVSVMHLKKRSGRLYNGNKPYTLDFSQGKEAQLRRRRSSVAGVGRKPLALARGDRPKGVGESHAPKADSVRQNTSAHFFSTMKLFYDKHYRHRYSFLTRWLVLIGIWLISRIKK